jgi:hypothetical protein
MKSLKIVILAACLLTLSACGQDSGVVVKDPGTVVADKTENSEVETVMDETTGESFTENDGPLDPKTLIIEEADPLRIIDDCQSEKMPSVVDRILWDFDKDGAQDAVVVVRCADGGEYRVALMRATSRGWWPKRVVGTEAEQAKITGGCRVLSGDPEKLSCNSVSVNKVTDEVLKGDYAVYRVQGEWVGNFTPDNLPQRITPTGTPRPTPTGDARTTPRPQVTPTAAR